MLKSFFYFVLVAGRHYTDKKVEDVVIFTGNISKQSAYFLTPSMRHNSLTSRHLFVGVGVCVCTSLTRIVNGFSKTRKTPILFFSNETIFSFFCEWDYYQLELKLIGSYARSPVWKNALLVGVAPLSQPLGWFFSNMKMFRRLSFPPNRTTKSYERNKQKFFRNSRYVFRCFF